MLIVAVKNTSGSTISAGQVVYQADYLRPQQLSIVALASAAAISTAEVLGICVWDIADNETGPIAVSGDVYPIDTSAFSAINDKVYLSDTPGAVSTTAGTVPAVIGTVKVVGAAGTINTTGTINIPTFSVTAITPSSGPTAGSTAVTITGAGFISVTDVTIGGASCTSIVTVDVNTITAVTPAGSAGAQDVVVTASAGVGTLTGGFTYVAVPTVTSITPTSGVTAAGTAVTIAGTNFLSAPGVPGASSVTIGGVTCTSIVYVSAISITALAPAGTAGAQDVVVTTPYGIGTLAGGFTYVAAPAVTSITPNSGDYLGGTAVTIAGTDFLTSPGVPGALAVTIGGTTCTTIVYVSSISITAVSPAGSAGAQDVVVTTNYGTGTLAGGFTYTTGPFNVYSMLFDGVSEYCESNSAASTTSGQPYSLSVWSKNPPGGTGWQSLIATGSPDGDISQIFLMRYYGTALYAKGPWGYLWGGSVLSSTEWNHIAFTHAGTAGSHLLTLYVDGASVATTTGSANLLDEAWNLGRLLNYSGSFVYGPNYIDEVSFFRGVALSLTEVQEIYNLGLPTDLTTHSRYTDLRSWWRMGDKMSGTTLPDQGPASNDLTAYNSPTLSTDIPTNEPSITSITPAGGLVGSAVTIAGSKFIDAVGAPGFVSVTIGGVTCTSIVAVSTASITAVAPAGTLGSYEDVVVTTVFGTATLSSGFYYTFDFRSMYFDGVDDSISTSGAWPELSASGSGYSVSFWAKLPNGTSGFPTYSWVFSIDSAAGSQYRMSCAFIYSAGVFRSYEGNADTVSFLSSYAQLNYLIVDTLWHHFVLTSTGTGSTNGLNIYLDGILMGSGTGKALGSNLATTRLFLASNSAGGGELNANIDEFAIFDTELSSTDVVALYNNGAPTDLSAHADIQHWWRMGDELDTASVIYDQEGSWDLDTPLNYPVLQTDTPLLIATQVEPYYGLSTGGTAITISGYNFDYVSPSNGVAIGGSPCTSIVVGSTTITAVTPSGSAGAQDLVITSGPNSLTLTDGFVYVPSIPAWDNASSASFSPPTKAFASRENWPELSTSGSGYSVSFWAKLPNGTSGFPTWNFAYTLKDQRGSLRSSSAWVYASGRYQLYEGNADTGTPTSTYQIYTNLTWDSFWHHYAVTSTGTGSASGVKFYYDGVLKNSFTGKALGSDLSELRLTIGSEEDGYNGADCNIDEFAMFGAELSAGQVTALYNNGIPADITAHANIQHYYRMGDAIGDTTSIVRDQIGGLDLSQGVAVGYPAATATFEADVPYLIATQVDPYYGDIAGSTTITITGSNLANVSAITVDGNPCTSIVPTASSVTADTPAGSAGAVDIVITDSTNTSEITLPNGFVYRTGSVPAWVDTYSVEFSPATEGFGSREYWPELSASGSGYSVSLWIKADTAAYPTFNYIFDISDQSGRTRISAAFVFATGRFRIVEGNADIVSYSYSYGDWAGLLTDTLWHHYAITSTGTGSVGGVKLYFDGVLQGGTPTGKALGSDLTKTRLFLGSKYNGSYGFDGNIDEFAMFGAELSAGQVTALYNSGTPTDITAHAGIQHYYRTGDSIGDTTTILRDQIGGLDLDFTYGTPVIDADVP